MVKWQEYTMGEKQCFLKNDVGKIEQMENIKLDHFLTLLEESTQNGLKTNIKAETIKLLEENTGGRLLDISLSNILP